MSSQWYRARTVAALGLAMADLRKDAGLSQADMARRSSSSRPTISRIERGEPVSVETVLDVLAEAGYEMVLVPRGSSVRIEPPDG